MIVLIVREIRLFEKNLYRGEELPVFIRSVSFAKKCREFIKGIYSAFMRGMENHHDHTGGRVQVIFKGSSGS